MIDTGRVWQTPSQYASSQYQANSVQSFTEVNTNMNNLPNVSTTTSSTTSKTKTSIVVGTIIGSIILLALLAVAITVPVVINVNNPITTTTTTTTTSVTTATTITTTQNPYICSNMTVWTSYDLPGNDVTNNVLANFTLCCAWCLSYSGCVSFTWGLSTAGANANRCFLKNGYPSWSANSLYVSGRF